ncbi:MAG: DoxX family membrane protein [Thermoplasmata archaeon]
MNGGTVQGFGRVQTIDETSHVRVERHAVNLGVAARILFGGIFLFDGLLKWNLFLTGQMQGVIDSFGVSYLSSNWVLFGTLVGLGETFGGLLLLLGLFQRPAAIWSAGIMASIWAFGGYAGWGQPGYTDPGGDLMLCLIFVLIAFVPAGVLSLSGRLHLRERIGTSSVGRRLLGWLVA